MKEEGQRQRDRCEQGRTVTHHAPPASRATAHGVDSGWNDKAEGTATWDSNEEMGDGMQQQGRQGDNDSRGGRGQ